MPTYEYRREDGTTFEVFQRMSDAPLTEDPETGQKVTRIIGGGAGLIFKGDGFYLTDYARKGNDSASKKSSADSSNSTDSSDSATSSSPSKSESNSSASGDAS